MPTALIAEDEPLLAAALRIDLAALWPGLAIAEPVNDGPGALQQALATQPTLCFLDIRMPGMSGLEVAQAMAEDWPDDAPFPLIVFVTAYDQYALQAFDAQAVDYLLKPVDRDRLAACVARLQARLADRAAPAPWAAADDLARSAARRAFAPPGGAAGPGGRRRAPGAGGRGDLLRGSRQVRARGHRRARAPDPHAAEGPAAPA
jgi:DNA-binding LytR/AlgR family response regulator